MIDEVRTKKSGVDLVEDKLLEEGRSEIRLELTMQADPAKKKEEGEGEGAKCVTRRAAPSRSSFFTARITS